MTGSTKYHMDIPAGQHSTYANHCPQFPPTDSEQAKKNIAPRAQFMEVIDACIKDPERHILVFFGDLEKLSKEHAKKSADGEDVVIAPTVRQVPPEVNGKNPI